jgi:LytS/YehU family sensor histidine kinase
LSSSIEKDISLAEEIEVTELYLHVENIRFNNEIEFELNIDNELALNSIKVPALIFQPFLENAIWHGLASKEGNRRIVLSILKDNDTIEVIIEDNGIGRARSKKLKENKLLKRESYGMKLTEDRLRSFGQSHNGNYSLSFEDLKDSDGNATGTRVRINLSIIYN